MKMAGNLWNRVRNWNGPRKRSIVLELGIVSAVLVMLAIFAIRSLGDPTGTVYVTANMSALSPTPVKVNSAATSSLSASTSSLSPPPPSEDESSLSTQYTWTVGQVLYKATQADQFHGADEGEYTATISPAQPSSSSNATLTFTPLVAGYFEVSTTCAVSISDTKSDGQLNWAGSGNAGPEDVTGYTLDITYTGPVAGGSPDSGSVVTNKTEDVHAGWPIQLGAKLAPSDLASKFTWKIDGAGDNGSAAINGYTVASDHSSATVNKLTPGNDTKSTFPDPSSSPAMLQSYYYTKGGSFNPSVQPQGVTGATPVNTTFIVTAPTTTLKATYQYATRATPEQGGPAEVIYLVATNAIGQNSATTQQAGILFSHPTVHSATYAGQSYYVQVYTENDMWTGVPPVTNFAATGTGLDGRDPYDSNDVTNGNDEVLDGPQEVTDNFANQVNYSVLSIDDSPTMWVMYTPKQSGSIDIPLASSSWHWGGTLTWNAKNQTWTLTNASPAAAGPAPAGTTDTYPVWNQILSPPSPPK